MLIRKMGGQVYQVEVPRSVVPDFTEDDAKVLDKILKFSNEVYAPFCSLQWPDYDEKFENFFFSRRKDTYPCTYIAEGGYGGGSGREICREFQDSKEYGYWVGSLLRVQFTDDSLLFTYCDT